MPCPNTISLQCCTNPAIVIRPCSPIINGVPYQAFIPGSSYLDNAGVCWVAVDSLPPTHYSVSNSYTAYPDCATCLPNELPAALPK